MGDYTIHLLESDKEHKRFIQILIENEYRLSISAQENKEEVEKLTEQRCLQAKRLFNIDIDRALMKS